MKDRPLPLSIIVLTHDEEWNLPACLESLRGLNCDLFVVEHFHKALRLAGAVVVRQGSPRPWQGLRS